jgi:hypothetical protein
MVCDTCDVCENRIVRDLKVQATATTPAHWLGICSCASRVWRWRSPTGDTPWELIR